jgi:hypothetical protein
LHEHFRTDAGTVRGGTRKEPLDVRGSDISIYWFSGNVAATLRIYKEGRLMGPLELSANEVIRPPMALAAFPNEIVLPPREWAERA